MDPCDHEFVWYIPMKERIGKNVRACVKCGKTELEIKLKIRVTQLERKAEKLQSDIDWDRYPDMMGR